MFDFCVGPFGKKEEVESDVKDMERILTEGLDQIYYIDIGGFRFCTSFHHIFPDRQAI